MSMYHLIQSNPRATVLAAYPKAACKREHGFGAYIIHLNDESKRTIRTGSGNPAQAWETACCELRLGVFANIRPNGAQG